MCLAFPSWRISQGRPSRVAAGKVQARPALKFTAGPFGLIRGLGGLLGVCI